MILSRIRLIPLLLSLPLAASALASDPYETLMTGYVVPSIVETTDPLVLYHWNDYASFEEAGSGTPSASRYVQYSTESTFTYTGLTRDAWGAGFYLATDPLVTRSFGGSDWAVLESMLAPRQKFLDMRIDESAFQWPIALADSLHSKFKCRPTRLKEIFHVGDQPGCHALKTKIIQDPRLSSVVGVLYNYTSIGYFDCIAPYGPGKDPTTLKGMAAFVWKKEAFLSHLLITARDPLHSPDVGRLQAQFEARKSLWDNYTPVPDEYPANGATQKPSKTELTAWLTKFTWVCRPNL